jgi:hypothetical protein
MSMYIKIITRTNTDLDTYPFQTGDLETDTIMPYSLS